MIRSKYQPPFGLNRFEFVAPLRTSVALERGTGSSSYTRASAATVKDFEGNIRNVLSGEVRFEGQRRVRNLMTAPEGETASWLIYTDAGAVTVTKGYPDPLGGNTALFVKHNGVGSPTHIQMRQIASNLAGNTVRASSWVKVPAGFGATNFSLEIFEENAPFTMYCSPVDIKAQVSETWQRFCTPVAPVTLNTATRLLCFRFNGTAAQLAAGFYIWHPQCEIVTGQSNQNPSEYVSVGAQRLNEVVGSETTTAAAGWGLVNNTQSSPGERVNRHTLTGGAVAHTLAQAAASSRTPDNWYQVTSVKFKGDGVMTGCAVEFLKKSGALASVRFSPNTGVVSFSSADGYLVSSIGDGWFQITAWTNVLTGASNPTRFGMYLGVYGVYDGDGQYVDLKEPMCYASQSIPTEHPTYFPVGNVYPFHGACVDGVKYFDYENGNTVSSNVVTEAVGRSLGGYSVGHISGATTDYFEAATTASTRPSGNTEVEIEWIGLWQTGTSGASVLCSYGDGGAGRGFLLTINNGVLTWYLSTTGAAWADTGRVATTTVPFGDNTLGRIKWVRTTAGVNSFYYSLDRGATWTKIGNDVSAASGAIFPTTLGYRFGQWSGGIWVGHGRFLRGIIRDTTAGTTLADFNPREGWTENLIANSTDLNTWNKFNGATASGNTMTAVTTFSYIQSNTVSQPATIYALRVRASASVDTPCALRVTDGADGNPVSSLVVNLTTTPQDFELIGDLSSGFSGTLAILIGGLSPTACTLGAVITLHGVSARRLSVASQRTSSQIIPTTGSTLRGWIGSTGEQWTIAGAATVLQRQAEGYLPEGASTNLVLQSSNFGTTWAAVGTPTRSAAAAYCGDIALDLLGDDDAGTAEGYYQAVTFTADADKSVSFIVKAGTSTTSAVALYDTTAPAFRVSAQIAWSGGVPTLSFTVGSEERSPEALGNGCYRCFIKATGVIAANTNRVYVWPAATAGGGTAANTGNCYFGGVQAENATVASSHIPTTTATVARNADVLTWPAAGNVGSSGGTAYCEGVATPGNAANGAIYVNIDDGTANNRHTLSQAPGAAFGGATLVGGVLSANMSGGTFTKGSFIKAAYRFATDNFAVAANGAILGTPDTSGSLPTGLTTIRVGGYTAINYDVAAPIKNVRIAQVAMPDGFLVALTV